MDSPKDISTIERFAAYIKELEADWNDPTNPPTYRGSDWWQLSEQEEWVFSLSLADMSFLVATWGAYQLVLENWPDEIFAAVRSELPWLTRSEEDQHDWQRFAALFSITEKKAVAFFWKQAFWTARNPVRSDQNWLKPSSQ